MTLHSTRLEAVLFNSLAAPLLMRLGRTLIPGAGAFTQWAAVLLLLLNPSHAWYAVTSADIGGAVVWTLLLLNLGDRTSLPGGRFGAGVVRATSLALALHWYSSW